jgi:tRNA pseudouridine55 synthase
LGRKSASDDFETDVELLAGACVPTRERVEETLPRFMGTISQRPPAFSAVKVQGRRAYKLARRGHPVEIAPREVEIYDLAVGRYEYPEVELLIRCSSGTYVRSLGRDLAEALGTHAVMSALERTAVGEFRVEDAMDARAPDMARLGRYLQSPLTAVMHLPRLVLSPVQVFEVERGGLIKTDDLPVEFRGSSVGAIVAVDASDRLMALLKEARPGWLKPSPNFLQAK